MDRDAPPLPRVPRQPSLPDLLEALFEVSAGFRGRRVVSRGAVPPRELDRVGARKEDVWRLQNIRRDPGRGPPPLDCGDGARFPVPGPPRPVHLCTTAATQ